MAEDEFSNEQVEFFENHIRPLLTNHCLECHGPEAAENDLRLDSRKAILKGGDAGPAVSIQTPESSLLLKAVSYDGDYDMPPGGKLSEAELGDLNRWVKMGMPWPESTGLHRMAMPELVAQHQKTHWAFQKIESPEIPKTKQDASTDLDRLVVARLEGHGMTPSPRADKQTLIRRAYFDIIGLPPTYEEVQSFVNDDDPQAYENLIDHLLQSPHYGERWARHWLDVARYADTLGYLNDGRDRNYPFAFTYRDYVIDAFNRDLPYNQFIREQLAADHLDVPDDNSTLAALGFLTVGRTYLKDNDTFDDQVDVVSRGLLGLTVSCARCHDHKYDAIPTEDYYSLFGVFQNNHRPEVLPLIGHPEQDEAFNEYFKENNKLRSKIEEFRDRKLEEIRDHAGHHAADYFVRMVVPANKFKIEDFPSLQLQVTDVRSGVAESWRVLFAKRAENKPVLRYVWQLIGLPDENFEDNSRQLIKRWSENEKVINRLLLSELQDHPPKSKTDVAKSVGKLFATIYDKWKKNGSPEPAKEHFRGPERAIAALVFDEKSPVRMARNRIDRSYLRPEFLELRKMKTKLREHDGTAPPGLRRAMILKDKIKLNKTHVLIRGNANSEGDTVPRRFLEVLSPGQERPAFERQSGRLDLAEHIVAPDNPLTARVLVNRIWMHHFSKPLVETPSDFGIRCPKPKQQDVLDYLARDFLDNGWSIKRLHKTIMLSDTYCQTSDDRPEYYESDPENELLWKMNRRRLEFEPLRDSILAVAGTLDRTLHGNAVKLFKRPFPLRRTIYGYIDRQDLPNLLRVFDLASPDQSTPKRIRTTVPQQSLYMLNSEFVISQAAQLVTNLEDFKQLGRKQRITSIYHRLFQRDPQAEELRIGVDFIANPPKSSYKNIASSWVRYTHLLLCSNEFEFID